ncbi:hypothetical protein [Fimbriiglobus ruber]|uniref:Uncharacterized protein n=1 Tax=Fimbriiglobus ruber TaxID=1908690 RepID=A0A225DLY4_9BACT|nr:hypothetical protein [Fimbriiglobus ruber]OWK42003.1 hypothetical protein FRUB_04081 [Fimbriiglobus ruber]
MNLPAMAIIASTLLTAQADPKKQAEATAKKIKELQNARIDALTELVDHAAGAFKASRGSYEEVLEAQVLLLKAKLDAAEKDAERIEIYERTVSVLKASEETAKARLQSGRGTAAAVIKIKARRLEVEVLLEQAKAKRAKEKK